MCSIEFYKSQQASFIAETSFSGNNFNMSLEKCNIHLGDKQKQNQHEASISDEHELENMTQEKPGDHPEIKNFFSK